MLKGVSYFASRQDRKNLPTISEAIKKYKPAFVSLQEIDAGSIRNGKYNQVQDLSAKLSLDYNHFAVEKDWLKYFNDGNALLSSKIFEEIQTIQLPYNLEKRNVIVAKVKVNKKPLTIMSTHLGAHKSNQKERMKQVKVICDLIASIDTPIVLLGDFNCDYGTVEFDYLKEKSGLSPLIQSKTYPTYNPNRSFDNIFVSAQLKVIDSGLIKEVCSDHYGVYAKLSL